MLEVQNNLQRKLGELSADNACLHLHAEQKSHLSQLSVAISIAEPKNLDTNTVDLVGSIGQFLCFERPMLLIMASTVAIQDHVLQYEYLQLPTPINGFLFSICSLPLFYYPKHYERAHHTTLS